MSAAQQFEVASVKALSDQSTLRTRRGGPGTDGPGLSAPDNTHCRLGRGIDLTSFPAELSSGQHQGSTSGRHTSLLRITSNWT